MKKFLIPGAWVLTFSVIAFLSCRKATLKESYCNENKPPEAIAGKNQSICLPRESIILSATASNNWCNNLNRYEWTKIAGPDTYTIADPLSKYTSVSKLVAGAYFFELKVINTKGLFSRDTVEILVKSQTECNNDPCLGCWDY